MFDSKLTTRTMQTGRGSTYTINLNGDQCADTRDALAKSVYAGMFDWIIAKLNDTLGGNDVPETDLRFIGFLDIFGFENFTYNTFEQLCINFTNERLQAHFTDALIKRQQDDYKREGVTCAHINFPDNQLQIHLIDGNKGSVYSMLDEECLVPKGTDEGYVGKMIRGFAKPHKCADIFFKPRIGKNGDKIKGKPVTDRSVAELAKVSFIITHYAGEVLYTADGWLEKNRGSLHEDLRALLGSSESAMIQRLFGKEIERKQTVGYAYRASLRALSDTMAATNQHYIRCLKPNMQKQKDLFHGDVMSRQLAYTGCSAVVEIQRSGYPVSFVLKDFVATYRCIAFREPQLIADTLPNAEIVANLLSYGQKMSVEKDEPGWLTEKGGLRVQVGKTKVFMRDDVLKHLEGPKNEVHGGAALVVQTSQRRHMVQKSMAAVNFHRTAVKEIKEALAKGDGKVAEEKLTALQKKWADLTLDESTSMVQTMKGQLDEVTQEVADLKDRVKIAWESGDRYEGAWRNENMNGKGTYYYADGNIYEGQWVEGNKHGEGTHTWVDGQVYKGQWVDDTMHGRGKYVFPNGNTYEGQYEGGVRHGKGKFTYANGGVYTGGFKMGKKNGHGTYLDPSGKLVRRTPTRARARAREPAPSAHRPRPRPPPAACPPLAIGLRQSAKRPVTRPLGPAARCTKASGRTRSTATASSSSPTEQFTRASSSRARRRARPSIPTRAAPSTRALSWRASARATASTPTPAAPSPIKESGRTGSRPTCERRARAGEGGHDELRGVGTAARRRGRG